MNLNQNELALLAAQNNYFNCPLSELQSNLTNMPFPNSIYSQQLFAAANYALEHRFSAALARL